MLLDRIQNILGRLKIKFTNLSEIDDFEQSIQNSQLWTSTLPINHQGLIPQYFYTETKYDDYFMIYNFSQDEYNTIPKQKGQYDFIYLAYNKEHHSMVIVEYSLTIE